MTHSQSKGAVTVGVLAGWQFYWTASPLSYLNPLFRGIRDAAQARGCNLLLACGLGPTASQDDPLRPAWPSLSPEVDFVPVGAWNTDGLIVANPLVSRTRSQELQVLRAAGHPVVFIAKGERGPTVAADNESGILQAIQHLVAHGHRHIAFIPGNPEDVEGDAGDRLRAYHAAVREFGLSADPRLVVPGWHIPSGGYRAMQQILASRVRCTAVLASNDESAIGAMQALHERGVRIPHDLAIIGFDDRVEALVQSPPLTTVHVPLLRLGYQAMEVLLDAIDGAAHVDPGLVSKVHTRLIVRQSCGCLPAGQAGAVALDGEPVPAGATLHTRLAQLMTDAVLTEAQRLDAETVQAQCEALVARLLDVDNAAQRPAFAELEAHVNGMLSLADGAGDDMQIWQAGITVLRRHVPALCHTARGLDTTREALMEEALDRARLAIGDGLRLRHWHYVVDQQWRADRVAQLTAQLLSALDRPQIYEVLARHLPAMGIQRAAVAFFEPESGLRTGDLVAESMLQVLAPALAAPMRFRTREFPPAEWIAPDQPFSLALLPLVIRGQQSGFLAFDSAHLELAGAIVRQLAAALNTAQLYHDASAGRQLAEEANRLKSRFLSTVSHELRTPLGLIVGLSELVLQEGLAHASLPDGVRNDLAQILANAQHLGWLIRDVLDLASSEVGQLRLTNELVDLSQLLQEVVETGSRLAHDKGLSWRHVLPAESPRGEHGPWVWGDRTRLRQVALNLVSNAVKFTSQGEVSLVVEQGTGEGANTVTVWVHDTGLGIPLHEQPFIFDEFRQSERTAALGYGGIGLGLAICERLVALHGGTIGVRSTGLAGAGSAFHFTLPVIERATLDAQRQAAVQAMARTVLLVATRAGSGERLQAYLARQEFEVQVVWMDESADWLAGLMAAPPGAVVLDVGMAPNQGWEILRSLKASPATQTIPVLFYSLAPGSGAVLELDYLTKPVGSAALAQALAQQDLLPGEGQPAKAVLIVDDEPALLAMHARVVQAQLPLCQVLIARNGREALEALERATPDVVLLDLMMPELDGFGVLEAMRARDTTRDIPVIVLTGQVLTESEMARLNRGVATVLEKGVFSVEETLAHVEAALARKRKLGSEAQRLVRRAMAYLHEHYADPLTRDGLARHVGMSGDYLTYCFRQELGMTPIAYLNRYRVNQAKTMLAAGELSVTEIALAVGYSDGGYFSRVFRREVGVAPETYRRGGH